MLNPSSQDSKSTAGIIPPHIPLNEYYSAENVRQATINDLFDHVAHNYNWISQVLSFGTGSWYRQMTLTQAGLSKGMNVLDVACGPGTVGHHAEKIVKPTGFVVGLDPSLGMLKEAQQNGITYLSRGVAENLPFNACIFDFVVMGYALRHVSDLRHTFEEYFRVLKPGGRILILELSRPHSSLQRQIVKFFLKSVIPRIAHFKSQNEESYTIMRYFWDTIENCVSPETILNALEASNFVQARVSAQYGGLIKDFSAIKPQVV